MRDVPFIIATSATSDVREALLQTLGCGDLPTTDADDVASPKPAPDLLVAACRSIGVTVSRALLVGDSAWDAYAAGRVGVRMLAVRAGGLSEQVLRQAGAVDVVPHPRDLIGRL